jgi:hypothetical protein
VKGFVVAWSLGVTLSVIGLVISSPRPMAQERMPQRFVRKSFSELDSATVVDLIQDTTTGRCWAVYRAILIGGASAVPVSEVPCK